MSRLSDLVTPSAISLDTTAADWRAAIRTSGMLLESDGIAEPAYTDAMIRTVEEHGPYIVISPGFALAHARPDASVRRTGMSFVRLVEPVEFGHDDNDPVRIVMALAAADLSAHQQALASLAGVLADPERRAELDVAETPERVREILGDGDGSPDRVQGQRVGHSGDTASSSMAGAAAPAAAQPLGTDTDAPDSSAGDTVPSKNLILTVCGNGLGTSLFLKNTAERVLDRWGWSPYLSIEATDTISAKGKAKDADLVLTSGAIADALGDIGVPVEVIRDFTSQAEIDAALRRLYAV